MKPKPEKPVAMNIEEVLREHKAWLEGDGGKQANLQEANLRGTDLRGAYLPDTDIFLNSPWDICHIRADSIRIGCKYHSVEEWYSFSKNEIAAMGEEAEVFYRAKKNIILAIIEQLLKNY